MSTWSTDVRIAADVFEHELWAAEEGVTAVVALGQREPLEQARARARSATRQDAVFVALFPLRRGPHEGTWAIMVRAGAVAPRAPPSAGSPSTRASPLEDTVCVGDWINDIPMFEVAGRSFAMGQAPDEVKSKATDVLDRDRRGRAAGSRSAIARAFGIRGQTEEPEPRATEVTPA